MASPRPVVRPGYRRRVVAQYVIEPGAEVVTDMLFYRWKEWCTANHRDERVIGDSAGFGAKLRAAAPHIERKRQRVQGKREYFYIGIRRKSTVEKDGD